MARQRWRHLREGLAEAIEVVMQGLTAGDHHKGRPLLLGRRGFSGEGLGL